MKPLTADDRKARPVYSGVLRYFPLALMEVARVSAVGHEQHNPGTPLRWDRAKSTDEADALVRHLLQAGEIDTDGLRHTAKVVWRGLAMLQKELEAVAESDTHVPDSRTPNSSDPASTPAHAPQLARTGEKPAHDELYAHAKPCAGGCGWLTYPETRCRKCRGKR